MTGSHGFTKPDHKQKEDIISRSNEKRSPWISIYISIGMQFVIGIQISIYYMSMWPYLSGLDPSSSLEFLGWVVASCSLGCTIVSLNFTSGKANPLFGAWNQKTLAVTSPTIVGMILAGTGQFLYGLLPLFPHNRQWIMILARFTTGCGAGCMSVLRAYLSMASTPDDRLKAISFGTAGFVLGLSLGPVVQACFTPLGVSGFMMGPMLLNMYTVPAYTMVLLSIAAIAIMKVFFREVYSGLKDKESESDLSVVPCFDIVPALICIYLWFLINMTATNIEVMSTPWTTAMYNWKDSQSVTYNALLQALSCILSVLFNFLIGYTRIGNIEKRHQVFFGLAMFIVYHLCNYPWPFYSGPLDYIPNGNTSVQIGGCLESYQWCADSVRVPLPVYIFFYIFGFGVAFPFVVSPSGTLFSEILGPRKQGTMQGLCAFGGSAAQFIAPIVATTLFERSGYQYVMVTQLTLFSLATVLMILFYKRMVPLKMSPALGERAKYKNGVFYAL